MKLSIIIPCYNEEKTLKKIVTKVMEFNSYKKEIIIIDDCSSDNSPKIIQDLLNNSDEIQSHRHIKNLGKGAAIKSGATLVHGVMMMNKVNKLDS